MLAATAALLLVTATFTEAVHPQAQQDQVQTSTFHDMTPTAAAARGGTISGSDGGIVPKVPWAWALSDGPAITPAVGGCGGCSDVSFATSETFERGASADDRIILAGAPWCGTDDVTAVANVLSRAPWVRNAGLSTMKDCAEVRFHAVSCLSPLRFGASRECGMWQVVLAQRLIMSTKREKKFTKTSVKKLSSWDATHGESYPLQARDVFMTTETWHVENRRLTVQLA